MQRGMLASFFEAPSLKAFKAKHSKTIHGETHKLRKYYSSDRYYIQIPLNNDVRRESGYKGER